MKLSKRLHTLAQMVTSGYTHIWDCCCDHGLLGNALLARQAAENIHFVDIVPELMSAIESKLQHFYPHSPSIWTVHCQDVASLPLHRYEGKHLVIIAGVGGDLMTRFIERLYNNYPDREIDFLLSPVHHHFTLRQRLIQLDFGLKQELLVKENQRFYEVMLVSSRSGNHKKVSPVGEALWQATTDEQATTVTEYLDKALAHYRRMQQGKAKDVSHIIEAYQAVGL